MSRRVTTFAALVLLAVAPNFARQASAQGVAAPPSRLNFVDATAFPGGQPIPWFESAAVAAPLAELDLRAPMPEVPQVPIVQPFRRIETGNSRLLISLYAVTAVTQALDIHSTVKALGRGGVETNPMLSGLTGNKAAFIAVKGAVAAGSIYAARQLAKRNKVAAVVSLVAINAAYGFVAHHNYKVASRLR